jgi:hypothetical protein
VKSSVIIRKLFRFRTTYFSNKSQRLLTELFFLLRKRKLKRNGVRKEKVWSISLCKVNERAKLWKLQLVYPALCKVQTRYLGTTSVMFRVQREVTNTVCWSTAYVYSLFHRTSSQNWSFSLLLRWRFFLLSTCLQHIAEFGILFFTSFLHVFLL